MALKIIKEQREKKKHQEIQYKKNQEESDRQDRIDKQSKINLKKENENQIGKELKDFLDKYKNELISYLDYFKKYKDRQNIKKDNLYSLDKIGKIKYYLKEIFIDNFYYLEVGIILGFYMFFMDIDISNIIEVFIIFLIIGLITVIYKKYKNKNLPNQDIGFIKSISIFIGGLLYITHYKSFGFIIPGLNFILVELFFILIVPTIGFLNFNSLKNKPKYIIDDKYINKQLDLANADNNLINYIFDTLEKIEEYDKKSDQLLKEYKNKKETIDIPLVESKSLSTKESNNKYEENSLDEEIERLLGTDSSKNNIEIENDIKNDIKNLIKSIRNEKSSEDSNIWKNLINIQINKYFIGIKNYKGNKYLLLKDIEEKLIIYNEGKKGNTLIDIVKLVILNLNIDYVYSDIIKEISKEMATYTFDIKDKTFSDDLLISLIEQYLYTIQINILEKYIGKKVERLTPYLSNNENKEMKDIINLINN